MKERSVCPHAELVHIPENRAAPAAVREAKSWIVKSLAGARSLGALRTPKLRAAIFKAISRSTSPGILISVASWPRRMVSFVASSEGSRRTETELPWG